VGEYVVAFLLKNPVSYETGFFVLEIFYIFLESIKTGIMDHVQKLGIKQKD
jgi:hypothetical protein